MPQGLSLRLMLTGGDGHSIECFLNFCSPWSACCLYQPGVLAGTGPVTTYPSSYLPPPPLPLLPVGGGWVAVSGGSLTFPLSPLPLHPFQVAGGWLSQEADSLSPEEVTFTVVSEAQPTEQQLKDVKFAWR